MPTRPPAHRPSGWRPPVEARAEHQRHYDRQRGSARSRGYSADWKLVRDIKLAQEPLCRDCLREGRATVATIVHHDVEVRDAPELRLCLDNLVSVCGPCHQQEHARRR